MPKEPLNAAEEFGFRPKKIARASRQAGIMCFFLKKKEGIEVLDTLSHFGQKISRYFGEPDLGIFSHSRKEEKKLREHFEIDAFSKVLPFEAYDESSGIFFSSNSAGFVVEAMPIQGGRLCH
ncbi:MAG: hypothetical protein ACE5GN_02785 [Waddliaceae bacterium]